MLISLTVLLVASSPPVVAVSFDPGIPRVVTVDAAGTLVEWDLRSKRASQQWTLPALAGATDTFVGPGDRGYAVANGQALLFQAFGSSAVETLAGARHIARGVAVVVAKERSLVFAPYSSWTKSPPPEIDWPEPILAVAAADTYVAVADRARVSLLDGRPKHARTLKSVPAPAPIARLQLLPSGLVLALDESGGVWAIDVHRGTSERLLAEASLIAGAGYVFVVTRGVVFEYLLRLKKATRVENIPTGVRSLATWGEHLVLGYENGEVVLATRTTAGFEAVRLRVRPGRR